jgi:hypothetical protein
MEAGDTFPIWQELVDRVDHGEEEKKLDRMRFRHMASQLVHLMYKFQQKYNISDSTTTVIYQNVLLARYPVTAPVCVEFYHSKVKEGDWNVCRVLICLVLFARESLASKEATDTDWEEWIDQM